MMKSEIIELIDTIILPENGFIFKEFKDVFWGKDSNGNIVFGLISEENTKTLIEATKSLSLLLNIECAVETDKQTTIKKMNIIVLKNISYLDLFIRLTIVFINNKTNYSFLKFFLNMKELFGIEGKTDRNELQGLFGELYTLCYFKEVLKKDISDFYQSMSKLKFDFSLSDVKKMEVKTTLKEERIHHFRNEQLNILRYDIKVVSILLQKDDKGLSLFLLIEKCKTLFSNNLTILVNIERIIRNWDENDLASMSFNEKYLLNHIRVYDSCVIPRITEKNQNGVFNVEYDSNLSQSAFLDSENILEWIEQ